MSATRCNMGSPEQGRPGGPRNGVPKRAWSSLAVLGALVLSLGLLPFDLTALETWEDASGAARRLSEYLSAFTHPDTSKEMLVRVGGLALDTVAMAVLGLAFGLLLAYPLALGASGSVARVDVVGTLGWRRRCILEGCRLVLDIWRGVPDFVWALLFSSFLGPGPVAGVLALGISIAGILGRVFSQQWDLVLPVQYDPVRMTGAGRVSSLLYGIHPAAGRTTLSFLLMRAECAVRNASVIGVVGGGGLGAGLWDEYTDRNLAGVATVLIALLMVTAVADLLANYIRNALRSDSNASWSAPVAAMGGWEVAKRQRITVALVVALLLGAALFRLAPAVVDVLETLARMDLGFVASYAWSLVIPSMGASLWGQVFHSIWLPLGISVVATLAGASLAAALVFPASQTFQWERERLTGERASGLGRVVRLSWMVAARGLSLVLRGLPEVGWLTILVVLLFPSALPCALAIALHTAGVLQRVFTEAVDDVSIRGLQAVDGGATGFSRFLYGALPQALGAWRNYGLFQFEVNVRAGVALGLVGVGGIGDLFAKNLRYGELPRASAFLWGILILTVLLDRGARFVAAHLQSDATA